MARNLARKLLFSAARVTRVRWAYKSMPMAVENPGCTNSPGMCDKRTGNPVRAGTLNWLSVTSSMPGIMAPPPVSTQPAPSASTTAPWRRLSLTK